MTLSVAIQENAPQINAEKTKDDDHNNEEEEQQGERKRRTKKTANRNLRQRRRRRKKRMREGSGKAAEGGMRIRVIESISSVLKCFELGCKVRFRGSKNTLKKPQEKTTNPRA